MNSVVKLFSFGTGLMIVLALVAGLVMRGQVSVRAGEVRQAEPSRLQLEMRERARSIKLINAMLAGRQNYDSRGLETAARSVALSNVNELAALYRQQGEAMSEADLAAFAAYAAATNKAVQKFVKLAEEIHQANQKAVRSDPVLRGSFGGADPDLLPPDGGQIGQLKAALHQVIVTCRRCHARFVKDKTIK